MVNTNRLLSTLAVAAFAALSHPTFADAQVCAGYAAVPGAFSAGANVANVPGGTSLGLEGSYNYTSPFSSFARFNLVRPEDEGENQSIVGVGVSYEITDFVPIIPTWLEVCPLAAVGLSSVDGTSEFRVPLGVGVGTTIPLIAGTVDLMPFAVPQFVLTRISIDDVSVSDHNFGIGFGALARFSNIYAGVTADKDFVDASDIDVSFRAGVTFPVN
jgi:hypothetical protein